jgi:hypothetical protein
VQKTPTLTRDCVAAHCSGPRPAATRSLLCASCRDQLDQHLRALSDLYAAMGQRSTHPRAAELRAAVRGVLATWAHVVVDGRGVARPVRGVAGMVRFLRRHVDWLGAHPAATEIAGEIDELVCQLLVVW